MQALSDDDLVLQPVHWVAWAAVAGLSALNCSFNCPSPALRWIAPGGLTRALLGLQRLVPLVFSALAGVAVLAHWQAKPLGIAPAIRQKTAWPSRCKA